jgi:amidase
MTDIAFASARRLAGMVRRRKAGCLELLEHFLRRVEKYNPALNAIIATDLPAARRRARAADRALKRGETWGPLHGVPMTVKESYDVIGYSTTWGLPEYKDKILTRNALTVDRWLESGVTLFGKTNVPVLLANTQTFNSIYGVTNNPWDPSRTPGGSSGGAAAALAAGLTGIEAGSDIGSSIRNPAHYCGVFGHKPTWGINPLIGHALGGKLAPADISVIGPLARSAGDLDLGLSIMAGPDPIDAAGYRLALAPARHKRLRDFSVAVVYDDPTADVEQEYQDILHELAEFLAGRKVRLSDKARPRFDSEIAHRTFDMLVQAGLSARMSDEQVAGIAKGASQLDPSDDSHLARSLRAATMSHRDWLRFNEERHKIRWAWHEFFKEYDLLLCPVLATAAPKHELQVPTHRREIVVNGKRVPFFAQLFWAGYGGQAFLPASVAPIGFTRQGLPVGVQIVGPQYGDRTTIQFAKLLEAEYHAFVPPPGYE